MSIRFLKNVMAILGLVQTLVGFLALGAVTRSASMTVTAVVVQLVVIVSGLVCFWVGTRED